MKFLTKNTNSSIYQDGLFYKENAPVKNKQLLARLINEQKHFCAYTEKYITGIDSAEVEHFNPSKKYNDDYFNYYAVIRYANLAKLSKDVKYKDANFFETLFFQGKEKLSQRIIYNDGQYDPVDLTDQEAIDFIDYLSLNQEPLLSERVNHIELLRQTFEDAGYNQEDQLKYLKKHPKMQDFITAIEHELSLDLSPLYQ